MPKTATNTANEKHGMSGTPEYRAWRSMRYRCFNITDKEYKNYGERGITVCTEWLLFSNFWRDMGPRPSTRHSLERKNNSLGYSPDNCTWALPVEQSNNKRTNHILTRGDVSLTRAQWARQLGVSYNALKLRIRKLKRRGKSPTLALY